MSALCLLTVGQTPAILRPIKAGFPVKGQGYSQAAKPPLRAVPAKARQLRAGAERRRIAPPPAHPPLASRPDGACCRQRPPASCLRSSPRLSPGPAAVPLLLSRGTVGVPPGGDRSCLYRRQMTGKWQANGGGVPQQQARRAGSRPLWGRPSRPPVPSVHCLSSVPPLLPA